MDDERPEILHRTISTILSIDKKWKNLKINYLNIDLYILSIWKRILIHLNELNNKQIHGSFSYM